MNDLMVFANEQFGDVRTIDKGGEIWFFATDVCRALGISNSRDAVTALDDDEKMTVGNSDGHAGQRGGAQSFTIINEPGLWSLTLRSRKPNAKEFKRWITHEVIPSIRKHGMYATDEVLDDPVMMEDRAQALRNEREAKLCREKEELLDTNAFLTNENKTLAAETERLANRLFVHDHKKEILDFINKCVRSYAGIACGGTMGYGWKAFYDRLYDEIGEDVRGRGRPYLKHVKDNEIGAAVKVAGQMSIRHLNGMFDTTTIGLMLDVAKRAV